MYIEKASPSFVLIFQFKVQSSLSTLVLAPEFFIVFKFKI